MKNTTPRPFENIRRIYFVVQQKSVLNVSKIRPAVLFCLTPRICTVYFQKAYGNDLLKNMRRIYFVVQQKSVLNVSKIRLRYFFCLTSPHICAEL